MDILNFDTGANPTAKASFNLLFILYAEPPYFNSWAFQMVGTELNYLYLFKELVNSSLYI